LQEARFVRIGPEGVDPIDAGRQGGRVGGNLDFAFGDCVVESQHGAPSARRSHRWPASPALRRIWALSPAISKQGDDKATTKPCTPVLPIRPPDARAARKTWAMSALLSIHAILPALKILVGLSVLASVPVFFCKLLTGRYSFVKDKRAARSGVGRA